MNGGLSLRLRQEIAQYLRSQELAGLKVGSGAGERALQGHGAGKAASHSTAREFPWEMLDVLHRQRQPGLCVGKLQ